MTTTQLLDALRTTGAVRAFTDEPVADEVVARILDNARFAPSGGNRQGWRVVVVKDPAFRTALRDLYLPGWYEYLGQAQAGMVPFAVTNDAVTEAEAKAKAPAIRELAAASPGFAENLHTVPVMLVLLADLSCLATVDKDLDRYTMAGGASIYPFVWSILLASRAEGIGGVITTMPIRLEAEVKALLDVPADVVVAGLMALGHPVKQPTKLKRAAVEQFTTVDRFTGPAFAGPASVGAGR